MATSDKEEAIREIAAAVGCSVSAVRRAVGGEGQSTFELAHRVRALARSYGEIPEFAALGPVMTKYGPWQPLPNLERNWGLHLDAQLHELLGDDAYLRLLEARAGTRTFVPIDPYKSALADDIGIEAARKLCAIFRSEYIRVPIDRVFRATAYRRQKLSNARIAVRLGISEAGVAQIFRKLRAKERHRASK